MSDHNHAHAIWLSTDGRAYCGDCDEEFVPAPGEIGRIWSHAFVTAKQFVDAHTREVMFTVSREGMSSDD